MPAESEPFTATEDEALVPVVRRIDPSPRPAWRGIGGAFAASLALHTLALASLALIVVAPRSGDPRAAPDGAIQALLVGSLAPPDPKVTPPASAEPRTATAPPSQPEVPPRSALTAAPLATNSAGPSWPWAGMPVDTSAPPSMLGSSAMVPEGVELYETRSLVRLGESIERRIRAGFDRDPDRPILLKPDVAIGYPLDALEAGIEGTVLVWFVVNGDGEVVEREAIDGPPELAEWALSRLPRLVDKPAFADRKPVTSWMALEIVFSRDAVPR